MKKTRLYTLLALVLILALCFSVMLMACEKKDRNDDEEEEEVEEIIPRQPRPAKLGLDIDNAFKEYMRDESSNNIIYYVGDKDAVDLSLIFPEYDKFENSDGSIIDRPIQFDDTKVHTIKAYKGSKMDNIDLHSVHATNVYADGEETLTSQLNMGQGVVMHEDITTKGTQSILLRKNAVLYGNLHAIHGDSIAAPRDDKKENRTSWGSHLFIMEGGSSIDGVNIIVNTIDENTGAMLEDFEYSGNAIDINDHTVNGKYLPIHISNCIVRNGQKLLHINGGDVRVKGCLFENSADASIASETGQKVGSNIVLENVAIRNSLIACVLFYGYENVEAGDIEHQQTLTIKGFFDIYNWVNVNDAMLVPNVEKPHADGINNELSKKLKESSDLIFSVAGTDYIHQGIMKLATGSCKEQNPAIYYEDAIGNRVGGHRGEIDGVYDGYAEKAFQISKTNVLEYVTYNQTQSGIDIMPGAELTADIIEEMRYGRA